MRTASVTGVRAHLSAYLDQVQIEGPLVITRNGEPVGVLIAPVDNDDLEGLLLARSPRFQVLLEQSRESIRQGKGLSHEELCASVEADQEDTLHGESEMSDED